MTKEQIISEIRRIAAELDGTPPGMRTFEANTGVRRSHWRGVYWRDWSEAVREAGLTPNAPPPRTDDHVLLRLYATLCGELGHLPTDADLMLKKRRDASFPSKTTYKERFGNYPTLRARAYDLCLTDEALRHIAPLLKPSKSPVGRPNAPEHASRTRIGSVYLIKHGSRAEYKIGKTFDRLRREGEIRLLLPEKVEPIHFIETDDPSGVEAYWHRRFADKRKEGEWFTLSSDDVTAFRRWRKIV